MLGECRQCIFRAPSLTTYPGLAIFLAVLGFNLFGDAGTHGTMRGACSR